MYAVTAGVALSGLGLLAQTDGVAKLDVTILDYVGKSGTAHWTVAWVTTDAGTFIKTLWKQGPASFPSHYGQHLGVWYTARGTSTALDGYTSATAANYSPPNNNPIAPTWDCRDATGALVPDGNYKFWVQYAEDSGQGPSITSGLRWTKGPAGATNSHPNQGANFANMKVTWTPAVVNPTPPHIASLRVQGTNLVVGGTGPANRAYHVLVSPDIARPANLWTALSTNTCDSSGNFGVTVPISPGLSQRYIRLWVP